MWFVRALGALALAVISGIYVRRRVAGALANLGVGPRPIRIVRWVMGWLLFAFPIAMIVSILASVVVGISVPRFDGVVGTLVFTLPFVWMTLVVIQSVVWLVVFDLAWLGVRRWRGRPVADRARSVAVLVVVGVFAIYTPARILVDRGELRVRHHALAVAHPTTSVPFRIGFLADVQQDAFTDADDARRVYAVINASQPDVVLSGGDWINRGPDEIEPAARAAGELASRLGTFSVRGDHEHFAYPDRDRSVGEVERAMAAHGVAMLNDEVRWFEHQGKRIAVVFLGYTYIRKVAPAAIATLLAGVAGADYRIVLTHQLDAALAAQLDGHVDLVLAGHTHGGQVNPVLGVTHVNLARVETAYVDGRYQRGAMTIIVTAGIGYSIAPIRYASPGSIELIELRL